MTTDAPWRPIAARQRVMLYAIQALRREGRT